MRLIPVQVMQRVVDCLHGVDKLLCAHAVGDLSSNCLSSYQTQCLNNGTLLLEWSHLHTAQFFQKMFDSVPKNDDASPISWGSQVRMLAYEYLSFYFDEIERCMRSVESLTTLIVYVTAATGKQMYTGGKYFSQFSSAAHFDARASKWSKMISTICANYSFSLKHFVFVDKMLASEPVAVSNKLDIGGILAGLANLRTLFLPDMSRLFNKADMLHRQKFEKFCAANRLPKLRRIVVENYADIFVRRTEDGAVHMPYVFSVGPCVVEAGGYRLFAASNTVTNIALDEVKKLFPNARCFIETDACPTRSDEVALHEPLKSKLFEHQPERMPTSAYIAARVDVTLADIWKIWYDLCENLNRRPAKPVRFALHTFEITPDNCPTCAVRLEDVANELLQHKKRNDLLCRLQLEGAHLFEHVKRFLSHWECSSDDADHTKCCHLAEPLQLNVRVHAPPAGGVWRQRWSPWLRPPQTKCSFDSDTDDQLFYKKYFFSRTVLEIKCGDVYGFQSKDITEIKSRAMSAIQATVQDAVKYIRQKNTLQRCFYERLRCIKLHFSMRDAGEIDPHNSNCFSVKSNTSEEIRLARRRRMLESFAYDFERLVRECEVQLLRQAYDLSRYAPDSVPMPRLQTLRLILR